MSAPTQTESPTQGGSPTQTESPHRHHWTPREGLNHCSCGATKPITFNQLVAGLVTARLILACPPLEGRIRVSFDRRSPRLIYEARRRHPARDTTVDLKSAQVSIRFGLSPKDPRFSEVVQRLARHALELSWGTTSAVAIFEEES